MGSMTIIDFLSLKRLKDFKSFKGFAGSLELLGVLLLTGFM